VDSSPLNKQYYSEAFIIFPHGFAADCDALAQGIPDVLISSPQGNRSISVELRLIVPVSQVCAGRPARDTNSKTVFCFLQCRANYNGI
jgi:hypothetical protein